MRLAVILRHALAVAVHEAEAITLNPLKDFTARAQKAIALLLLH